jgi:large subunit ribosomal protein L14e
MDLKLGQLVKSLSGRDKEKLYLVIGFTANRILLADGRNRTVKNPKQKNRKHLQPYRVVMDEINKRFQHGDLNDTVIRNSLKMMLGEAAEKHYPPCLESSSSNGG